MQHCLPYRENSLVRCVISKWRQEFRTPHHRQPPTNTETTRMASLGSLSCTCGTYSGNPVLGLPKLMLPAHLLPLPQSPLPHWHQRQEKHKATKARSLCSQL